MFDLSFWLLSIIIAILIGFSKTSISTLGIVSVVLMMQIFPAKDSVGVILPMLIIGDIIAVIYYRKSVVWKYLLSLTPSVIVGIIVGYFFLLKVNNEFLALILGILILTLIFLQLIKDRIEVGLNEKLQNSSFFTGSMGALAGFATMIGNVAGAIMAIYLLAKELPKKEFIGTGAWFFLIVNVIKVPFYIHLTMITTDSLIYNSILIPFILLGGFVGIKVIRYIPQKVFQWAILIFSAIGAVRIIITYVF